MWDLDTIIRMNREVARKRNVAMGASITLEDTKTIKAGDDTRDHRNWHQVFIVQRLYNSVQFTIGDRLTKAEVWELIYTGWSVTIVGPSE